MRLLPLCIAALLVPASAAWAGQPLNTEDAAVLERSDCEVETSLRRQTARAADPASGFALKIGCGPINTLKQVFDDPHVKARGMEVQMKHSSGAEVTVIANPVRLSETPADYRIPPPLLGEHTSEVLQDLLGIDSKTYESLKKKGII